MKITTSPSLGTNYSRNKNLSQQASQKNRLDFQSTNLERCGAATLLALSTASCAVPTLPTQDIYQKNPCPKPVTTEIVNSSYNGELDETPQNSARFLLRDTSKDKDYYLQQYQNLDITDPVSIKSLETLRSINFHPEDIKELTQAGIPIKYYCGQALVNKLISEANNSGNHAEGFPYVDTYYDTPYSYGGRVDAITLNSGHRGEDEKSEVDDTLHLVESQTLAHEANHKPFTNLKALKEIDQIPNSAEEELESHTLGFLTIRASQRLYPEAMNPNNPLTRPTLAMNTSIEIYGDNQQYPQAICEQLKLQAEHGKTQTLYSEDYPRPTNLPKGIKPLVDTCGINLPAQ